MASYGESVKAFRRGDKVKGKVIEINPKTLILDIGGKGEGMVAEKAFAEAKSFINTLKVGDEIEGTVIVSETPDGYTIVSLRNASQTASWDSLAQAKKDEIPVNVTVKGVNDSGAIVDVKGVTGFIPKSQLGKKVLSNLNELSGKSFKALIIDLEKRGGKVVLSEKAVSEKESMALIKKALKTFKEGDIYDGVVTTVADFGAFVEIKIVIDGKKVPVEGLVHISELSWRKVGTTADEVEEGDPVTVKVIDVKDGKLALSMKQAERDPWEGADEKYKSETNLKGKITKISDFGVFVEIEAGIEGLIHITKIPPDKKLKKGDIVNVYVETVSEKEKKLSLGLVLTAKPVGYK